MNLTLPLFYVGEEDELQKNGKVFAKLALGEYEWMSYNMVHASVVSFGAGLRFHLKQQPGSLITMYAETRAEWMISCLGAFSQVRFTLFNFNLIKPKENIIDKNICNFCCSQLMLSSIFITEYRCCNSIY